MREKEGDLESGIARADISQNAQHFLIVRLFIYEYSLVDVGTSQRRTNRFLGSADITSVKSINCKIILNCNLSLLTFFYCQTGGQRSPPQRSHVLASSQTSA